MDFDHDDMKTNLLTDLIESLMKMKDPSQGKDASGGDLSDGGDMDQRAASPGMNDMDPKAKIAMLEMKTAAPGGHEGDDGEDEDADMGKALGDSDFQAMRKKHMMGC